MPASPKNSGADAENGDGGWEGRRRSGSKIMQKLLFNDIPDSDGDDKFHNNGVTYGRDSKKKVITPPPAPIFNLKTK